MDEYEGFWVDDYGDGSGNGHGFGSGYGNGRGDGFGDGDYFGSGWGNGLCAPVFGGDGRDDGESYVNFMSSSNTTSYREG